MKKINPYKKGQCDAFFGRPCFSPWKNWPFCERYVLGYLNGKELMRRRYE